LDKLDKLRVAVIESVLAPRKVMLIVLDLLRLRNVRTHLVPTIYPERSGNVEALNL
jgi:hypothetical protein